MSDQTCKTCKYLKQNTMTCALIRCASPAALMRGDVCIAKASICSTEDEACLMVSNDFGCIHHEPREGK